MPHLVGTLIGPFGRRALLVSSDGRTLPAASEAGVVGAWTLKHIAPGSVMLVGPGGTRELRLALEGRVVTPARLGTPESAWSWANPCGRLHQRGSERDASQTTRCGFKNADLGRVAFQP